MTRARTCPSCGARWTLTLNPGAPRQPWHDDPRCADCRRAPAEAPPEPAAAPDMYASLSALLTPGTQPNDDGGRIAPTTAEAVVDEFTCPKCGQDWTRRRAGREYFAGRRERTCGACRTAAAHRANSLELPVGHMPGAWIAEGLCAQTDPELFHPEKGGSTREAKAICGRCPVIEPCRTWAIDTAQTHGVWGGLSPRERSDLAEQRATAAAS